jgi:hypothetical protein
MRVARLRKNAASTSTAVNVRAVPQKRKAPGFSKLWIRESRLTARGGTGWDRKLVFLERQCWVELALNTETRLRCACLQCAVGNGDGKDCNTKASLRTTQNPLGGLIVCARPTRLPSRANSTSGAPWSYRCNQQRRSRACFSASNISRMGAFFLAHAQAPVNSAQAVP